MLLLADDIASPETVVVASTIAVVTCVARGGTAIRCTCASDWERSPSAA
jgi:type IV secretory pathway VirB2 component (pilin)